MTASEQIDAIIKACDGWKAELMTKIRHTVLLTNDEIKEEIKWKMATRPQGLAVWSHAGIICFAEIWKDNIKLLFPKGAHLDDPNMLFNSRLNSKDIRAIEFKEGSELDSARLSELVNEAIELNISIN